MRVITKREIKELSKVNGTTCISIFIPTHRSGQEVLQQKDALVLKNQLKDLTTSLEEKGHGENDINKILSKATELLDDTEFWRHQSDGLAIFIAEDFFKKYTVPVAFEAFNYVGSNFYLKPLMPLLAGDGRFFILAPELGDLNFYEATRHSITDIYVDDLTPSRIEERVGYDYKESFLQFRSSQGGPGQAAFHGHGDGKDDRKLEIEKYFKAINDGLMKLIHDEQAPMILACLDYLAPIYKKVNDYNQLIDDHVSGNPGDMDRLLLHKKAWEIIQPYFTKEQAERKEKFLQNQSMGKTSASIHSIVPAAIEGKIEALFVENRTDIWGVYNPDTRKLDVHKENLPENVSLLNLATIHVFLNGGTVYLVEKAEMPDPTSQANALYRF